GGRPQEDGKTGRVLPENFPIGLRSWTRRPALITGNSLAVRCGCRGTAAPSDTIAECFAPDAEKRMTIRPGIVRPVAMGCSLQSRRHQQPELPATPLSGNGLLPR